MATGINYFGARRKSLIARHSESEKIGRRLGAALGGAIAGAAAGTVAGPIGTVVGTIAGGGAGAYAGKAIAEDIDPTVEANYWREAYSEQPYYSEDYTYQDNRSVLAGRCLAKLLEG